MAVIIKDFKIEKYIPGDRRIFPFIKRYGTHLFQIDPSFSKINTEERMISLIIGSCSDNIYFSVDDNEITGIIAFRRREWDTVHFGYPVASIDHFYVSDGELGLKASVALLDFFLEWSLKNKIRFVSIKTYPKTEISQSLSRRGFYCVGSELILTREIDSFNIMVEGEGENIRPFKEDDMDFLISMTEETTFPNRFHHDFRINEKKASDLYVQWLKNGSHKKSKKITVVEYQNKPAGYILWSVENIFSKRGLLTIGDQELVVIEKKLRGKGLSKKLYAGTLSAMKKEGVDLVKTTISSVNMAALNSQARLGFNFNYVYISWHAFLADNHI